MQKQMRDGSRGPVEPLNNIDDLMKAVNSEGVSHIDVFGIDEARKRIAGLSITREQKKVMLAKLLNEKRSKGDTP